MNTKTNYFHFLWLLMALIYFSMANGNAVPVAAWLGPLFFMRFMRKVESKWGLVIAAIGLGFAYVFSLYEPLSNSNISPLMRVLYCFLFALVLVYPSFLVDRFFNKRLQGILNTLVFPAAFVVIEYVNSLISPFSTFGFAAYTQYENLPLIQLSSITGIWGIAFLLMWFSSVVNYVWERGFKWNEIKVPFVAYFSVIIAVLTFGGLRLNQLYDGNLVRVAISSLSYDSRAMFTNAIETGKAPDLAMNMKAFDKFFESTANMRVKIIVWQEYALTVAEADIESLKKYVSNKVKIRGVYCTLPVGIAVKGKNKNQLKNCVYLFGPDGNEIAEYTKSYTAPWETSEKETKEVTVIKTDLAILAMTICFDMDFPSLIRQAGAMNSDIMLAPSFDWRGIVPFHSCMAVFRAIENGFSMVRSAGDLGKSIAVDYYGRNIGCLDNRNSSDKLLVVDVPLNGVSTIYSNIGDIFAWMAIGFLGYIVLKSQLLLKRK